MWSSWVKIKGTTQVMYIAKLKDGEKRAKKTFSMILERVFEMVWWRGRKWITSKRIFEVEVFFSSQNIDFPFYLRRLLELFFLFPFYSFFYAPSLEDLGVLMIFLRENHFFKILFSNGMTWNDMIMTMDILVVDAYSEMELCTPI
jgi:hypothetical protein